MEKKNEIVPVAWSKIILVVAANKENNAEATRKFCPAIFKALSNVKVTEALSMKQLSGLLFALSELFDFCKSSISPWGY